MVEEQPKKEGGEDNPDNHPRESCRDNRKEQEQKAIREYGVTGVNFGEELGKLNPAK